MKTKRKQKSLENFSRLFLFLKVSVYSTTSSSASSSSFLGFKAIGAIKPKETGTKNAAEAITTNTRNPRNFATIMILF